MSGPRACCTCLLLSVTACGASNSGSERADVEQATAPSTELETDPAGKLGGEQGPEYFFGVLGQSGVEQCPGGNFDAPTWNYVHPTLGFVGAGGPGLADVGALEVLYDQPVLARGLVSAPPEIPVSGAPFEPCMPMQMRSDWVNTPRGIRCMRSEWARPQHFHTTGVRRLDELEVAREGDEIVVSFRNPLPFALEGALLRVHYEGCYGKPGTAMREGTPVSLAPGEVLRERFSLLVVRGEASGSSGGRDRSKHAAAEIELSISGAAAPEGSAVHVDLSASLRAFGIQFDCGD